MSILSRKISKKHDFDSKSHTAGTKRCRTARKVVEELYSIAKAENAEIARLGEERIIVAPSGIKIWKPEYDLK